jgi:hypothetical protein
MARKRFEDEDDDRDEEYDDRPRRRKPSSALPLVMILGGVGVAVAGCIGFALVGAALGPRGRMANTTSDPTGAASPAAVHKIGEWIKVGDAEVRVTGARETNVLGRTQIAKRQMNYPVSLVVSLEIRVADPDRTFDIHPQTRRATATDDKGNRYKPVAITDEFGGYVDVDGMIRVDRVLRLRSDAAGADKVVFERPPPGANEVTVSFDATAYGGTGRFAVAVTRDQWTYKP